MALGAWEYRRVKARGRGWRGNPACYPGQPFCRLEGRRRQRAACSARTLCCIVKLGRVEPAALGGAIGKARKDGRVEETCWRWRETQRIMAGRGMLYSHRAVAGVRNMGLHGLAGVLHVLLISGPQHGRSG